MRRWDIRAFPAGAGYPRISRAEVAMKLLDQCRHTIRLKHYSYRTEQCYVSWIEHFIRFHQLRHPNTMSAAEVEQFLTHLAVNRHVSASTQNQALSREDAGDCIATSQTLADRNSRKSKVNKSVIHSLDSVIEQKLR